jgi:hypothetical protein
MYKLIDALTLTADHETAWINQYGDSALYKTPFKDCSIQVAWEDVAGTTDGTLEVIGTLGEDGLETLIDSVVIDSVDNTADCHLFSITNTLVSAIKLRYTENGITSVLLNAVVVVG